MVIGFIFIFVIDFFCFQRRIPIHLYVSYILYTIYPKVITVFIILQVCLGFKLNIMPTVSD